MRGILPWRLQTEDSHDLLQVGPDVGLGVGDCAADRRDDRWPSGCAPRKSNHWPRKLEMDLLVPSSACVAVLPRQTMTLGSMAASWRSRNGMQVATSSFSGVRFSGGRHFTTLAM